MVTTSHQNVGGISDLKISYSNVKNKQPLIETIITLGSEGKKQFIPSMNSIIKNTLKASWFDPI